MLNKKGESMVEVIVSLVLFIILLVAVSGMVQTSLGLIIRTYEINKNLSQSIADIENEINLSEIDELSFSFEIRGEQYGVLRREINIPVSLKQSGGIKIYAS